jgi:hypothetical protein
MITNNPNAFAARILNKHNNLKEELCIYLDSLTITSHNIGDIRRSCFVPWISEWNGIVRDETAARENTLPFVG